MSDYDSFRFSLNFSASFWSVFLEHGAAPPVHASISVTSCSIPDREFLVGILMFNGCLLKVS